MYLQTARRKTLYGQDLFRLVFVSFGVSDYSSVVSEATFWIHQGSQLPGEAGS